MEAALAGQNPAPLPSSASPPSAPAPAPALPALSGLSLAPPAPAPAAAKPTLRPASTLGGASKLKVGGLRAPVKGTLSAPSKKFGGLGKKPAAKVGAVRLGGGGAMESVEQTAAKAAEPERAEVKEAGVNKYGNAAPAAPAAAPAPAPAEVAPPTGEGEYYDRAAAERLRLEQARAAAARLKPKREEEAPRGMEESVAKLKEMTGDFFSQM